LWIGKNVLGAPVDPDTKITIIADDSYIIDQDSERKRWQTEISMGIRSAAEYRMHFFGETEDEANEALARIKSESPSTDQLFGNMA
jgi:hypothetical protein